MGCSFIETARTKIRESDCEQQVIEGADWLRYLGGMPAQIDIGSPSLTWEQLKEWINLNAWGLLEFAKAGFSESGRGLVILAGTGHASDPELTIKCRYIMPEEIGDVSNEALDLAQRLVDRYDPENEFVVVSIDARCQVTSALVAVSPPTSEFLH